MILYIKWIKIFQRIWTFCSSNVHDFPLLEYLSIHCTQFSFEFWLFCTFNDFKIFFFHEFGLSMHLIYWFSIEFSRYRKVNEFEFFYESGLSVHLMYTNFLWTFTISYISWIKIFPQNWTFYTSSVHNFPLKFHDIIYSSNSNFSMNPDFLYIYCS